MFTLTLHFVDALKALCISFIMSIVFYILACLFTTDRSNGNETGTIAGVVCVIAIVIANTVAFIGALFWGISSGLVLTVGAILFLGVILYSLIIGGKL